MTDTKPITYEAYRITYQSDVQAARALWADLGATQARITELEAENQTLRDRIDSVTAVASEEQKLCKRVDKEARGVTGLPEPLCVAIIQAGRITGQFKDEKEALDAIEAAACEGQVVSGDLVIEEIYTAAQLQQAVADAKLNRAAPVAWLALHADGRVAASFSERPQSAGIDALERDGGRVAQVYELSPSAQLVEQAQAKREPMTSRQMESIFLASGFTIKEGHAGLKPYVFAAGRAIEAHHNIGDKA